MSRIQRCEDTLKEAYFKIYLVEQTVPEHQRRMTTESMKASINKLVFQLQQVKSFDDEKKRKKKMDTVERRIKKGYKKVEDLFNKRKYLIGDDIKELREEFYKQQKEFEEAGKEEFVEVESANDSEE